MVYEQNSLRVLKINHPIIRKIYIAPEYHSTYDQETSYTKQSKCKMRWNISWKAN